MKMTIEKMTILSRCTKTNLFSISHRTLLIKDWKTAGKLVRPNDMTRYSSSPVRVLKAVFHSNRDSNNGGTL